jgi:hypothetical protein
MATRSPQGEIALQGGGLLLRFLRVDDRYAQQLLAVDDQKCIELLTSIEGTTGEVWPVSPPLAQIDRPPERVGVHVALLVGMSGRNHWSLSAKLDERGRRIEFDVASRISEPSGRLSSTYRLSKGVRATEGLGHVELTVGAVRCRIEHKGDGKGQHGRMEIRDGQLVLKPPAIAGPFPATVCWRYAVARIE